MFPISFIESKHILFKSKNVLTHIILKYDNHHFSESKMNLHLYRIFHFMKNLSKYFFCQTLLLLTFSSHIYGQNFPDDTTHLFSITQNLKSPVRIAIDNADNLFVTDAYLKSIIQYNASGNFVKTFSISGTPLSITVSDDNKIFYGNSENGKIYQLNLDGSTIEFYSGCIMPSSMAFSSNNLYVSDSKLAQVFVLDLNGNLIRIIGNGTLVYPTGIAYDRKNNHVIVGEHGAIDGNIQTRVYIFDLNGNVITNFGPYGSSNGRFYRIQGIAVEKVTGNIFVVDAFQGNVSVFNENGIFIAKFAQWGTSLGQLNIPLCIAFNSQNRIFVTSLNNEAIEVFGGNINPLPVELMDFYAIKKDKSVLLKWRTASEINCDKFFVERSQNGIDFFVMGSVKGAGNSVQIKNYEVTDNDPFNGINYYRLKQTYFTGGFKYFKVVSVFFDSQGIFTVRPNLTEDKIEISLNVDNENIEINISSADGKKISQRHFENIKGYIKYEEDLSKYPVGIYYVSMRSNSKKEVKKIVKY